MIVAVVDGSDVLDTGNPDAPGTPQAERKARDCLWNFLWCVRRTPGSVVLIEEPRRGPRLWAMEFSAAMGLDHVVYGDDGSLCGRRRGEAIEGAWCEAPDATDEVRREKIARVCGASASRGDLVYLSVYVPQYPREEAPLLLAREAWKATPPLNRFMYRWTFRSMGTFFGGRVK